MTSRRQQSDDGLAGGQDAFLDVVANLVGILVILIMVIGVRTREACVAAATDSDAHNVELPSPEAPRSKSSNIENDIRRMEMEIGNIETAASIRRAERDELLSRYELVRQAVAAQQDGLTDEEREHLKLFESIESARAKLHELDGQQESLAAQEVGPRVLQHDPTPLAETVFGSEEHFRLLGGRLDYVPLRELVDRLRDDASRNAWRMKDSPELTETLGPVDGYFLRYTLALQEEAVMTPQGPAIQRMVALDQFILIPMDDRLGKPLEELFQPGSELATRLRGFEPSQTTITVWTYPDSYQEFRELRAWLHDRGFRAAARPLPAGQPIAGSPRGTRSAAQ